MELIQSCYFLHPSQSRRLDGEKEGSAIGVSSEKKEKESLLLRKTAPTSHSFTPPIVPLEIPDTQSPMRSSVTGKKVKSEGWMLKAVPAKVKDKVAFVVQGRVKPGRDRRYQLQRSEEKS